jgi:cystathionine beta-lyase
MKKQTRLINAGKKPFENSGMVNIPIYKSSTILFPTWEDYVNAEKNKPFYASSKNIKGNDISYGLTGTPTTYALQDGINELEGDGDSLIFPSGLLAITTTLLALLEPGDHLLMVDSTYGPTRRFCNSNLKKLNIETTYYDPLIGSKIENLIQDNTKVIFLESPGSLTFEIQDIPAIVKIAKEKNIITIIDNSWATPIFFNSFKHQIDISILAGTKYICGYSDFLLGTVSAKENIFKKIYKTYKNLGIHTSPEDCYLALRGIKSLYTRLKAHEKSAIEIAKWLENNPLPSKVLHPALDSHPQNEIFLRDFSGSSGLFSFIFKENYSFEQICKFINSLKLFGIGASWGGYESLVINFNPSSIRTAKKWEEKGTAIRLYIGLEDTNDLIEDLDQAFNKIN